MAESGDPARPGGHARRVGSGESAKEATSHPMAHSRHTLTTAHSIERDSEGGQQLQEPRAVVCHHAMAMAKQGVGERHGGQMKFRLSHQLG